MQLPESGAQAHPLGPFLEERIAAGGEIARLTVHPVRYWIALAALALLGLVLVWTALSAATLASTVLGALGLVLIYAAARVAILGRHSLILTAQGLTDTRGRLVAGIDEVRRVERGMFALRPSNGFGIRLKGPAARGWQPGLWWRWGSYVGIGGLTPAGPGRAMADLLDAMIAQQGSPEG